MNIICGSEKKCGTEFEKANWASKMRVAFRLLYVIAASLPVLKPAEFAVFCDRGFGFRNGIGERLLQKAVAFGVFCVPKPLWAALTAGCFLSGLVHFSFRIAVTDSGLPRFGKLRAKHWKCLIKSRLVFIENKVCSEHHGRQNCGKAKCPHKSTGIGCSGECNEPFFANRLCICFVVCRTIPLQKSAAKACFSAERIVIGLLSVSVTYAIVLHAVRSVRGTKNPALNYNFRVEVPRILNYPFLILVFAQIWFRTLNGKWTRWREGETRLRRTWTGRETLCSLEIAMRLQLNIAYIA